MKNRKKNPLSLSDFENELQKNKIKLLGVSKDDWFDRFTKKKRFPFI